MRIVFTCFPYAAALAYLPPCVVHPAFLAMSYVYNTLHATLACLTCLLIVSACLPSPNLHPLTVCPPSYSTSLYALPFCPFLPCPISAVPRKQVSARLPGAPACMFCLVANDFNIYNPSLLISCTQMAGKTQLGACWCSVGVGVLLDKCIINI